MTEEEKKNQVKSWLYRLLAKLECEEVIDAEFLISDDESEVNVSILFE